MITQGPSTFAEAIPAALVDEWRSLEDATLNNPRHLNVCLVGAFSVGKSSLVNTLLGRDLLPTAPEESTALPTFIEYGEQWGYFRTESSNETRTLSLEEFQRDAVTGADPGTFLSLTAPATWLQGIYLVDLPGTGGNDETKRQFAMSQIRMADVVLYVLPPRGASRTDYELLRLVQALGKTVRVLVSQWDMVLKTIEEQKGAQVEPLPNLTQRADDLFDQTGLRTSLIATSTTGMGKDLLISFLGQLSQEARSIRQARFAREGAILLRQAVSMLEEEQGVLAARNDEEQVALREQVRMKRDLLLGLKEQLQSKRETSRKVLESDQKELTRRGKESLHHILTGLKGQALSATSEEAWQELMVQGNLATEQAVVATANGHRDLFTRYGEAPALDTAYQALNFAFPPAPMLDADAFLEAGQLRMLENQIIRVMAEIENGQRELPAAIDPQAKVELLGTLKDLHLEQQNIETFELPMIEKIIPGTNTGRLVGRVFGEVADIALMFANPTMVGAKVAGVVGQGAKAAKVAADVAKAVQGAQTVVAMSKSLDTTGDQGIETASPAAQLLQKASFLQMLSAGYWGEKIGGMFDRGAQKFYAADPDAVAKRHQALLHIEQRRAELLRQVEQIQQDLDRRELTTYIVAQKEAEKRQLEQTLETERERAEQEAERIRSQEQHQFAEAVRLRTEQAMRTFMTTYEQKTIGMGRQLSAAFKNYWQTQLDQALSEHEGHLRNLEALLLQSPQEKHRMLGDVQSRIDVLKAKLAGLT